MNNCNPLESTGFATLSDLEHSDIKLLYSKLSQIQNEFLQKEENFRSIEYQWPRDALNNWSRIWEYPFTYYNLNAVKNESAGRILNVVDFGSGVTFFPFAVSRLGCNVTCVDIDPICERDIPAAAKVVQAGPGSINVSLLKDGAMSLEDESQDIVYCVSVLEHIPNFEKTIDDIARVLKSGGKFILTVDIDMRGDFELSAEQFHSLQVSLSRHFTKKYHDRVMHPLDILTSANSPKNILNRHSFSAMKRILKSLINGNIFSGDPRVPYYLAVHGGVYIKKAEVANDIDGIKGR